MLIALLGLLIGIVALTTIAVQIRRGQFFTLLTFAAVLFAIEGVGAAIRISNPDVFPDFPMSAMNPAFRFIPRAFAVYIGAFLLFLVGYAAVALSARRRKRAGSVRGDRSFMSGTFVVTLMLLTFFATVAGFVQQYVRIRAAGGLSEFLANAYQYRFGSFTESTDANAVVGLTNLISGTAVGLAALWLIAWARGLLTTRTKAFVVVAVAFLLFREWASMFRATLFFTILALIAAVETEHKLTARRMAAIGMFLLTMLLSVNFVHYYLYSVTGGWGSESFLRTQEHLLAPQFHIYTLAQILAWDAAGGAHLHGKGILEGVFFFVPRLIWNSKLPSTAYGTMVVQTQLGLPDSYQMAITDVGEFIAHFGYAGIGLMTLYGLLYGLLDQFRNGPIELRAALVAMLLPRVLADRGMGISAVSITLVSLGIFLAEVYAAELTARLVRSVPRLRLRLRPRAFAPAARPWRRDALHGPNREGR